jgi:hypothetical protein
MEEFRVVGPADGEDGGRAVGGGGLRAAFCAVAVVDFYGRWGWCGEVDVFTLAGYFHDFVRVDFLFPTFN